MSEDGSLPPWFYDVCTCSGNDPLADALREWRLLEPDTQRAAAMYDQVGI